LLPSNRLRCFFILYLLNIVGYNFILFKKYYIYLKKSFFLKKIIYKKNPSANAKGLGIDKLPKQDDFRNFCIEDNEHILNKMQKLIS